MRQQNFKMFLALVAMPAVVHAVLTIFFGLEAEGSAVMLFSAAIAAGASGAFLYKWGYGPVESTLAAAWPSALAAWGHWHWALGMPSPGGAAQNLAKIAGWEDAPMPAAVAAATAVSGAAGWLFLRIDRWYKGKTGRSFFEES